jgi:hypothetical protein
MICDTNKDLGLAYFTLLFGQQGKQILLFIPCELCNKHTGFMQYRQRNMFST